jgi:DNA polymerase III subunit beta
MFLKIKGGIIMTEQLMDGIDIDAMDAQISDELKVNVSIAIQTELLKKLVGKVERSVAKKAAIDIMRFVYIDIQEDKLTFRGMNSDYTTEAFVIQNEEKSNFKITEGTANSVCFPADKFVQIVKKLKHKDSSIKIENNYAVIKSGRPKFDLHAVEGDQYPRTPQVGESEASVSIHASVLNMMYDRTTYAASTMETRPVLTGVYHDLSDGMLRCVATDSHRLAQFVYELDSDYPDVTANIPAATLAEVKKHLAATEGEAIVHFYNSHVVYEFTDSLLYTRKIEGIYPETSKLIFSRDQAGTTFTVNAGALNTLLSNSTVYNPDQPIILRIKPEDGQLRVNTREAEVGAFEEDLAITDGVGNDVVLAVNVRYMQDALKGYGGDDYLTFEFLPPTSQKAVGMQPFKGLLKEGNPDCVELFVPVRSNQIDYDAPVSIEDFQGVPEFDFKPFENDFAEIV